MTLDKDRIRGADAKALLDNVLLRDAFAAVGAYIEQKALGCDPDNRDAAQRIVLSKQLLAAIRREIERHIEDGEIARIEIAELERKRAFRLFQR